MKPLDVFARSGVQTQERLHSSRSLDNKKQEVAPAIDTLCYNFGRACYGQ